MIGKGVQVGVVYLQSGSLEEVDQFGFRLEVGGVAVLDSRFDSFHDPGFLLVGEGLPLLLVDRRPDGVDQVVGDRDGLGHFVELRVLRGRKRVVLTVYGPSLQGHIELAEGDRGGVRSEGFSKEDPGIGVRHPKVHAAKVGGGLDFLVIDQVQLAGSEILGAEGADSLLFAMRSKISWPTGPLRTLVMWS